MINIIYKRTFYSNTSVYVNSAYNTTLQVQFYQDFGALNNIINMIS